MRRGPLALLLLGAVGAHAHAGESCAIVVAAQPEPDATALKSVRQKFGGCRFVADAEMQPALERFDRPPPVEERVRDALASAHARMRRFDTVGVRQALDDARRVASELPATSEARQLMVSWALQSAELAGIAHDAAAQLRAMRLALSVEPELQLDAGRNSPTMVALLLAARSQRARAQRVGVPIASEPAGAQVWAAAWRGETPATVELPAGPTIVWLSQAGHHSRIVEVNASDGARVKETLAPLAPAERLRPFVDAVRQAAPDWRRQPALALAAAVGVDGVIVVDPDGVAKLYDTPPPLAPPPVASAAATPPPAAPTVALTAASSRRPWYKRTWPWVLLVGGAAAAATAVSVGVVYGAPPSVSLSCCR